MFPLFKKSAVYSKAVKIESFVPWTATNVFKNWQACGMPYKVVKVQNPGSKGQLYKVYTPTLIVLILLFIVTTHNAY